MTAEGLLTISDVTEERTPLPEGWRLVRIGELCTKIDYGFTASADFTIKEPKFLRITDIQNGNVDWEKVPSCKISEKEERANLLIDGDIVFARTGGTVGKSFLITNPPRAVFASYLIRLSPNELVDSKFLYFFFQSNDYWRQIKTNAQGGAQPNVNATVLSSLKLALPPTIEDQRRIATILDEQIKAIEQARLAVEDQLKAAKLLPNSFLRSVFESEEAKQWKLEKVGNISLLIIDGPHVTPFYVPSGVPFLTVRNIVNRRIDFSETSFVTEDDHEEFKKRGRAERGDILYTKDGTLGIPCVVDTDREFSFFVSVALIKLNREIANPYFIAFALESPSVLEQVKFLGAGAGLKHMVLKSIRSLEVPLPSTIKKQKEVVEKLTEQMQEFEKLKKTLTDQLEAIEKIPSALLRKAFAGQL